MRNENQLFPFKSAVDYNQKQSIISAFGHLKDINKPQDWENKTIEGIIINSGNADNIHRAIKYSIWATSNKNIDLLNSSFERSVKYKRQTYLFFKVCKQNMFTGVARLASYHKEISFPYWWADYYNRFKGHFDIEWIYIKDIDQQFGNQSQSIYNLWDGYQISQTLSKKILSVFSSQKQDQPWIFNDFKYLDQREEIYSRQLNCRFYSRNAIFKSN